MAKQGSECFTCSLVRTSYYHQYIPVLSCFTSVLYHPSQHLAASPSMSLIRMWSGLYRETISIIDVDGSWLCAGGEDPVMLVVAVIFIILLFSDYWSLILHCSLFSTLTMVFSTYLEVSKPWWRPWFQIYTDKPTLRAQVRERNEDWPCRGGALLLLDIATHYVTGLRSLAQSPAGPYYIIRNTRRLLADFSNYSNHRGDIN